MSFFAIICSDLLYYEEKNPIEAVDVSNACVLYFLKGENMTHSSTGLNRNGNEKEKKSIVHLLGQIKKKIPKLKCLRYNQPLIKSTVM